MVLGDQKEGKQRRKDGRTDGRMAGSCLSMHVCVPKNLKSHRTKEAVSVSLLHLELQPSGLDHILETHERPGACPSSRSPPGPSHDPRGS